MYLLDADLTTQNMAATSVANHFNRVPICFFDVKRFFIVTIITFHFECLQFHIFLIIRLKEINNTKTNHLKSFELDTDFLNSECSV